MRVELSGQLAIMQRLPDPRNNQHKITKIIITNNALNNVHNYSSHIYTATSGPVVNAANPTKHKSGQQMEPA